MCALVAMLKVYLWDRTV